MTDNKKPFRDLLDAAPRLPAQISLVGSVMRSASADNFALSLSDGREVTLPIEAVQDYEVLGGTVGRMIVRVDIETGQLAEPLRAILNFNPLPDPWKIEPASTAEAGAYGPAWHGKTPYQDLTGYKDPAHPPKVQYDPPHPFVAATPHQASPEVLAAMQSASYAPYMNRGTGAYLDKRPIEDGTYPTPHGIHRDY